MQNVIERIAHYADIDTRRALGFGPRKLVLPELNLFSDMEDYLKRRVYFIQLKNARIYKTGILTEWVFGGNRCYCFKNGTMALYFKSPEHFTHPDFSEEGTLRAWRT